MHPGHERLESEIPDDIKDNQNVVKELKGLGYTKIAPRQIMQHLSKIAEELDLRTLGKLKKASDDEHTYGLLKDVGAQLGVNMGTGLLGHGYAKAVGSAATDNAGWNNSHPEFIKKIVDYAGLKGFYHNPNSIRQHPTLWDAINHKFGKPYVPKDRHYRSAKCGKINPF